MKYENFKLWDIVIYQGKPVQVTGGVGSSVMIQDIHTKEKLTVLALIDRKATKQEVKWFCENTEHINFTNPEQSIR